MVFSGEYIARFIKNISENQIQPSGVDLTVDKIYRLKGRGEISKEQVTLPNYNEIEMKDNVWTLLKGNYIVSYEQIIKIPKEAVGLVLPRSSLMRMGAMIFTALWDPGYEGKGASLLVVFNDEGIKIEKGARIAQLIIIKSDSKKTYSGRYMHEGLK